jgi:hypothetical protein
MNQVREFERTMKSACHCIFFSLLLLTSCKKDVPGPKGDSGEPGKNGNAIEGHFSLRVDSTAWTFISNGYEHNRVVSDISPDLVLRGDAEVYLQIGNQWWGLPHIEGDVVMQASIENNLLRLRYFKIHGTAKHPGTRNFRVVTLTPVK